MDTSPIGSPSESYVGATACDAVYTGDCVPVLGSPLAHVLGSQPQSPHVTPLLHLHVSQETRQKTVTLPLPLRVRVSQCAKVPSPARCTLDDFHLVYSICVCVRVPRCGCEKRRINACASARACPSPSYPSNGASSPLHDAPSASPRAHPR